LWQKGRKLSFARERGARPVIKLTVVGNFKLLGQSGRKKAVALRRHQGVSK
jgi:hypothetical protein